jgi:amino acid permease
MAGWEAAMTFDNLRWGGLLGLLLSFAIVITNVIVPSVVGHPSPDNGLSESIGWIIVIAIMGSVGFLKVRRTSRIRDSMIAGAVISFVAFALAMITFLIIDNLFLSIVAQQPEKIWLFEHSRYPDMKSYLNHTNVRAFWTALPVITVIGAVCGWVGGYLNLLARRRSSR